MQGWYYPKFKCLDALHTPSQRVKKLHFFRILTNHWGTDSGVAKRKWPLDKILVWTSNSDMNMCSVVSIPLWPYQLQPVRLSVFVILQARILAWIAISLSRRTSWPTDWTWISCVSCIGRQILYHWAPWEAPKIVTYILIFPPNAWIGTFMQ